MWLYIYFLLHGFPKIFRTAWGGGVVRRLGGMAGNWAQFWQCRLVLGMWNVISFAGNKPKLVRELECYWLDRLATLQRIALALEPVQFVERSWTLSFYEGKTSLQLSVLKFFPGNKKAAYI